MMSLVEKACDFNKGLPVPQLCVYYSLHGPIVYLVITSVSVDDTARAKQVVQCD